MKAISRGIINDEDARAQMEKIRTSIAALKVQKTLLRKRADEALRYRDSLNDVESVLGRLADRVDNADDETKALLMRRLVEKVVIEPDEENALNPPRAVVHYLFNCDNNGRPLKLRK